MTYCTDQDLLKYRSDILDLNVDKWDTQRDEATAIINRTLTARWYNKAALIVGVNPLTTPFNPDRVNQDEVNRLACFKTLELAYAYLTKNSKDADGFERLRKLYKTEYGEELDSILGMGLTYDWDGDGIMQSDETKIQAPRRIKRC